MAYKGMAVRWLTPFRWLHDRLHAEKRHYPHVTVDPIISYTSVPATIDYTSPSVHYLNDNMRDRKSGV